MKIDAKSLEFSNCLVGNRPPPILFYVPDSNKKLSSSDYQAYKLRTNLKDKKLAVIKGQDIQDGEAAYSLVKILLKEDALQAFQDKDESQDIKDSPAFTKSLVV
eukprot:3971074-Ditylum_brightwellii.AAC.1